MKKLRWTHFYIAALLLFTVFIALDTFVISYNQGGGSEIDMSMFEEEQPEFISPSAPESSAEEAVSYPIVTDTSYIDKHYSVTISELYQYDTLIHIAKVEMDSARYLKTAFAEDTYGKNIKAKTSDIADEHGAILAVNGDYYGAREKGIVIRNGVLYRSEADELDLLCIYADGSFKIYKAGERTAEELMAEKVWQCMTFGPGLIADGEITVTADQEVGNAMVSNPRTAIGLIDDLTYVFIVSDGRTDESEGLSLRQLAEVMKQLDVKIGYNLDGGGSSTMYFNGEVINKPTTYGEFHERRVSDIVYVG